VVKIVTFHRLDILFIFALFFSICFSNTKLDAQDSTTTTRLSSYEGIHFLVGFLQNEYYVIYEQLGVDLRIFIATKEKTKVDIIFPDNSTTSFTLPADTVISLSISNNYYNTKSEKVVKNAIEINSDNPIVVYTFNSQERTSDSYTAIPISNWGTEYVIMSMPNDQYTLSQPPHDIVDSLVNYTPRNSEFLVIAAYDSTVITFKPKVLTEAGKQIYNYYSVKLNKGETYLVKSYPTPMGTGDLTGTLVTGNKPFGVLSGHLRTSILQGLPEGKDSKDHLAEMLMPVSSWGTTYISVPFGTSPNGDYFRITCIRPQTNLYVYKSDYPDGYSFTDSLVTINIPSINTPVIWQADKPIQIAQFMQRTVSNDESKYYDPSMVMLPPREQFVQTVLFTVPGGTTNPRQYLVHFVTIIAEQSAIPTLFLDDKKIDTITNISKQQILNTNLYWCLISDTLFDTKKAHKISSTSGKFSGIIFGKGEFDSYAMALGSSLVDAEITDEIPPVIIVDTNCFTIKGKIYDFGNLNKSGIDFASVNESETKNFNWKFDPIAPNDTIIIFTADVVNIYTTGKLVIDYWDKVGNKGTYIYNFNPVKLQLPTDLDFNSVNWTDSVCIDFVIKNLGEDSLILQSVVFPIDPRISLYFETNFPKILRKNESILGKICFDPENSTQKLTDSLQLQFNCGIIKSIPIRGNIIAPDLEVSGWDFGNVYLLDSASGTIFIKNKGNVPLVVDSLHYLSRDKQFEINDTGIFIYNLLPDSTLNLNVKFKPTLRGQASESLQFSNHLNLSNQLELKGIGVAPEFSSQIIDFGKKRIGINYDSIISIKNTGNIASVLKFKDFVLKNNDDYNTNSIAAINSSVDINSSYPLSLQFGPIDTSNYHIIANLECDWKHHPAIQIDISGKGTIPVIKTQNVNFDTISYSSQKSLAPIIISNTGNEDLTIDSIFVLSGSQGSFTINYSALKNFKIPIDGNYTLPITFIPQELGENILLLGVANDALPSYQRRLDTVIVRGYAVAPSNLNVDMKILSDMDFTSCLYDTLNVQFINNEPFEVSLTKIDYKQTPNDWQLELLDNTLDNLPVIIPAKGKYEFKMRVLFKANQSGEISLTGYFNDSTIRTAQLTIQPKTNILDIINLEDMSLPPDSNINITFSGNILSSTDIPTSLNFKLDYDVYVIYLLDKEASIKIIDVNNNINIYKLKLTQSATGIELDWDDAPRFFSKGEKWEISLNFLPVVSKAKYSDLIFSIEDPNCYNRNEIKAKANIFAVCMNDLIIITLDTTNSYIEISPNPIKNLLKIDLYLFKNTYIRIFVFDELGKYYILEEKKYLLKGKNSLIYVVDNLTNGKYFLNVQIDNKIETKNIILNR